MEKDNVSSSKPESSEKRRMPPGLLGTIAEHADWVDIVLMTLGTAGCIANGLSMSLIMLVLSRMTNSYASMASINPADINQYALTYMYVAIVVGSGAFIEGFCWGHTAERQSSRMRIKYLKAVLRQEIGYFDNTLEASRVVTNISTDISINIQGVLSEKIPDFIANLWMFATAELTAMYLCWRLAIVALPAMFVLILPGVVYGTLLAKNEEKLQEAYAVAGGIAEQAFSSIKTVHSYAGEERMVNRFSTALGPTLTLGIKQGLLKGMAFGSIGIIFAIFALMSWYGSILVIEKGIKGGDILSAGVCIVYGGFGLGASLMNIKHFAEAKISAALVSKMIDRVPSIDSTDEQGETISAVKGELEFRDIDFAYPSRPESLVLKKFNLKLKAYQTVGLVGHSGSGKSTVINLLERFYDPTEGGILLDGISIKSLQLKWLRSQLGLVSQEPILFATSIKENIIFGKEGATDEEIVEAAKKSNAHNFITQLPNGYNTLVGELGTQMSGGQKQRISIARALLREPKILLLDEATSSLDSHSEKAVQEALTHASVGRTTIVIAHCLYAIRHADLIVVIKSGEVIESGSHDELTRNTCGSYSIMVSQLKTMVVDGKTQPPSEGIGVKILESPGRDATTMAEETINGQKLTGSHLKEVKNQQSDEEYIRPSWWHLMQMTAPEWKSTLMGSIGALISGSVQPLIALFQAAMLSIFFLKDHDEIRSQTRTLCYAFIAISASAIIASVIQHYFFGVMGETLTKKIRLAMFERIMSFEIEWFDQENNSTGALCSRLSTDTLMVRNLVADRLAFFAQSISASILAITWGLLLSWRLALVAISLQLFIVGSFYLKLVMTRNMSKKILHAQNKSSGIASEAVGNHRIITAYYSQEQVMRLYEDTQKGPKKESQKQPLYAGMALFTRQFLTTTNIAVLYWYGGKLLYQGDITYKHMFQTFYIVVTAGILIAEAGSMTEDLSVGTNALKSIFTILKRDGKMDPLKHDALNPTRINGQIQLREVDFVYLTRPTKMVLNGLSLKIEAGEVAALVGTSGSGKSTIIGMIQRFYDPTKGSVEVDGIDIKCYNLKALRSFIAWVGQEPTLFAGTVKENIAYGKENATEAEMIQAASLANIHEFISSMKDGYDTVCGERGMQLSGGQKQRIAIARAILKNPAILLLDEATSALDVRSETIVQDAIEKTMVGRTCVIIAHRLSTIQRSNKIVVMDNGSVVEEGSHHDLLAKGEKGAYFSLFSLQQQSFASNKENPCS
ncbi:putative multidrug resistance protein [Cynara cardunculus var. scolymus]|uniref:putative multidrug resistance protein n=1 Tax=Cynara cardunculus var. scolymus TaxID=59895 RepID=UPI000D626996|nr:putative multidrug resistance protein [Cynara cardunculus var. scolymus]